MARSRVKPHATRRGKLRGRTMVKGGMIPAPKKTARK